MEAASQDPPRLLFVTPTYPDTQGNGLAMRAGMFLESLARVYRVSLLVLPLFGKVTPTSQELTRRCCEEEFVVEPAVQAGPIVRIAQRIGGRPELLHLFARQTAACKRALEGRSFDVIHAFRFYTAPIAISLASSRPKASRPSLHLDLDDVESSTHARLAELYLLNRRMDEADVEANEARRYEAAERKLLPGFERVYVCSEGDADQVGPFVNGDLRVAPNAVRPPASLDGPLTTHPFTFLFVGTLGYYPNNDAVRYFAGEVLPKVRAQASAPFIVRIVGPGLSPDMRPFARVRELRLVGEVADVGREYADADAVIVPIRGGGGTRIKVLEAFAHRRPVVATSMGLAGIDASPEEHCLVGDTPGAFAAQCLRLMNDRELGAALAEKAYALVTARYSLENVMQAVMSRT